MSWASSLPAAIDALVALWSADSAIGAAGVWVSDGPPVGDQAATEILSVGHNGDSEVAATGYDVPEGFGGTPNREDYTVSCAAAASDGSSVSAARARAFDLFGSAAAALEADRTLGGLVLRAMPGAISVQQSATSRGFTVNVQFQIAVTAYTQA